MLYPCLTQFEHQPHHYYTVNNKEKYKDNNSACAIFSPHVPVIRKDNLRGDLLDQYYTCSFVSIPAANAFVVGKWDCSEHYHTAQAVPKAQPPGTAERIMEEEQQRQRQHENNNDKQPSTTTTPNDQDTVVTPEYEKISLRDAMYDRIYRALSLFYKHGCTDLVLCAFGCGVHGNHPLVTSKIFRELLLGQDGQESPALFAGKFRSIVFAIQPSRHGNYKAFTTTFPEARTCADYHLPDDDISRDSVSQPK